MNNEIYSAKDMLHGIEGEFTYLECGSCGCVQLLNIPQDLSKYYPDDYYSYHVDFHRSSGVRAFRKKLRVRNALGNPNVVSRVLGIADRLRKRKQEPMLALAKKAGIRQTDAVLDVGCGAGGFLLELADMGFSRLRGVDLFIDHDLHYPNGVQIVKKSIFDLGSDNYDFITLHHSFEHMPQPLKVMQKIQELLRPEKYLLVRMPAADSYGWEYYRSNWFHLDAPRHLMIHTRKSMQILAEKSGFVIDCIKNEEGFYSWVRSECRLRNVTEDELDAAFLVQLEKQYLNFCEQGRGDLERF